jgi:hypothetical protein
MAPVSCQAAVAMPALTVANSGAVAMLLTLVRGYHTLSAGSHAYGTGPSPIPGSNAAEIMHTMRLGRPTAQRLSRLTMARLGQLD